MALTAFRVAAWLILAAIGAPAAAEVELAFHGRDGDGRTFPHAFITLTGETGPGRVRIDRSAGFTAVRVSMDILAGPVPGALQSEPAVLVARSKRYLAVRLSDARFHAVTAAIRRWRAAPQPSYHLERRNCVHFVAEIARAAGLKVPAPGGFWRDPQGFLTALAAANGPLPAQRPALSQRAI